MRKPVADPVTATYASFAAPPRVPMLKFLLLTDPFRGVVADEASQAGAAVEPAECISDAELGPATRIHALLSWLRSLSPLPKAAILGVPVVVGIFAVLGVSTARQSLADSSSSLGRTLRDRATIELREDFTNGLAAWGAATDWKISSNGVADPAKLALFQPSLEMSDYRLEFAAVIEKKGLGWVIRAAGEQNYYAMKLAIPNLGQPLAASLLHYTVQDGKAGKTAEARIPVRLHPGAQYKFEIGAKDSFFTTKIDGQTVDTWSDEQFKRGGVGFFCDKGESARLLWVAVTDRDDWLGELCSYFVSPAKLTRRMEN